MYKIFTFSFRSGDYAKRHSTSAVLGGVRGRIVQQCVDE